MNYTPLVSVIIPVYNGSNYLNQAIDSALNQTYANMEIIVVNDGSTDGGKTEQVAKSYGDRIRYILKENGGTATAINCGIQNMRGDYASWLSHDDLYLPDKIEKQVAFLNHVIETYGEEEAKRCLIYCATETINSEGKLILRKTGLQAEQQTPPYVFKNMMQFTVCGCATLIPKELFEEIGMFDVERKTVQDSDFWYRVSLTGHNYFYLNEYLVQNRRHPGQTSHQLKDEWLKEIVVFEDELIDKIYAVPSLKNRDVLTGVCKYVYIRGCKENRQKIKGYLLKEAGFNPWIRVSLFTWCGLRIGRDLMKEIYNRTLAR